MPYKYKKDKHAWYLRNKDRIIKKSNIKSRKYYIQNKNRFSEIQKNLKLQGCAICGYDKCYACLDYHHVVENTKETRIHYNRYPTQKIIDEINKCMLLCVRCHREIHWGEHH